MYIVISKPKRKSQAVGVSHFMVRLLQGELNGVATRDTGVHDACGKTPVHP